MSWKAQSEKSGIALTGAMPTGRLVATSANFSRAGAAAYLLFPAAPPPPGRKPHFCHFFAVWASQGGLSGESWGTYQGSK